MEKDKKEEKKIEEKPKEVDLNIEKVEPKKATEEEIPLNEIIQELYQQLSICADKIANLEKDNETLKMNQAFLQTTMTNVLKTTQL